MLGRSSFRRRKQIYSGSLGRDADFVIFGTIGKFGRGKFGRGKFGRGKFGHDRLGPSIFRPSGLGH